MDFDTLMGIALAYWPGAYIGQDEDGQIVIYTALTFSADPSGPLVLMED